MVAASGPTGILAGRPNATLSEQDKNGTATSCNNNGKLSMACNNNYKSEKDIGNNNQLAEALAQRRHESDLYVRPSWTDAAIALHQLEKVKLLFNLYIMLAVVVYGYYVFEKYL